MFSAKVIYLSTITFQSHVKIPPPLDCPDCYSLVEREVDLLKGKLEELKEIMSDVDAPTIEVRSDIRFRTFCEILLRISIIRLLDALLYRQLLDFSDVA